MIVTGAFLADAAAEVTGALNIWRGVLFDFTVGSDRSLRRTLVILTQRDSGSPDPTISVEVINPDGEVNTRFHWDVPDTIANSEVGYYYSTVQFECPEDGRYVIVVKSGVDSGVALPLVVHAAPE